MWPTEFAGVALSGKAGAGKDTFCDSLSAELATRGIWAAQANFADALKKEVFELFGLTKADKGGREKLIEVGQGRRERQPMYWIDRLAEMVEGMRLYGVLPIVTDMRYLNEYQWARDSSFLVVRIDATAMDRGYALYRRGEDPSFCYSDHETETALDDVEFNVRFWNPHGDAVMLRRYAFDVADILDGTSEVVAA